MISTISRGATVAGLSIKNILYFLLFSAVILFLFFIPEISKLDWGGYFSSTISDQARTVANVPVASIDRPLDKVIEAINAGRYAPRPKEDPNKNEAVEKPKVTAPFNPELSIKKLNITKTNVRNSGRRRAHTQFALIGSIKGADVSRMDLFRNGSYEGKIGMSGMNREGRREFSISRSDARGVWTIRIEDKQKRVYEKSYRFFPAIEKYPRDRNAFRLRYNMKGLDPQIEKEFTVYERIPGKQSSRGFVVF